MEKRRVVIKHIEEVKDAFEDFDVLIPEYIQRVVVYVRIEHCLGKTVAVSGASFGDKIDIHWFPDIEFVSQTDIKKLCQKSIDEVAKIVANSHELY